MIISLRSIHTSTQALTAIAALVVSGYMVLVIATFFCAMPYTDQHSQDSHHVPLCAWACQAHHTISFVAFEPPALPMFLTIALLVFFSCFPHSTFRMHCASRGPPA